MLFLREANAVVATCALLSGTGSFDVKFLAFARADGGDELLAQLMAHASLFAQKRGVEQLIALFTGSRADAG